MRRSVLSVVAASVVTLALAACSGGDRSASVDPAAASLPARGASSHGAKPSATQDDQDSAVPFHKVTVYYLGDGPRGAVLFRQGIVVLPGLGRMETALDGLLEQPDLPSYHTLWKPGWLISASTSGGHITVDADGAPIGRPPGMDVRSAAESVQQVVYTLQSATRTHDPVQFTRNGRPASSVLGVSTRAPVQAAPLAQTVSMVSIADGTLDGTFLSRGPIPVTGLGNTAHGLIEVRLEQRGRTVRTWTGHTAGSAGLTRLYPWRVVINTTGLPSGHYQVVASGPDPSDPALTVSDERPLLLSGRH